MDRAGQIRPGCFRARGLRRECGKFGGGSREVWQREPGKYGGRESVMQDGGPPEGLPVWNESGYLFNEN